MPAAGEAAPLAPLAVLGGEPETGESTEVRPVTVEALFASPAAVPERSLPDFERGGRAAGGCRMY